MKRNIASCYSLQNYLLKALFLLLISGSAYASEIPNMNQVFTPSVKTVQVYQEGFEMSDPLIYLHQQGRLVISFDDLDGDLKSYRYTAIHCDFDWRVSGQLTPSEYLEGFHEENIYEYAYSFNTTIPYTHYRAYFPTGNMKPKISGNYLLKVYTEHQDEPVFIWRIMVVEPNPVMVEGFVGPSPFPSEQTQRQQVNFRLRFNGFLIGSPSQELKICVRQNFRWDNMVCDVEPGFFRGDEIDYRNNDRLIFNGGNEYRSFDMKSLKYQSDRIARITWDSVTRVMLTEDVSRASKNYILEGEINGQYLIRNDDYAINHDTESDYAVVLFSLRLPDPDLRCRFFLMGGLNGWNPGRESMLYLNPATRKYELAVLLKQGYYNYQYVCVPLGRNGADETVTEGNYRETENIYFVLVYYRPAGALYDRLISVTGISSTDN